MALVIIDPIPWNYTPDTPYEKAIGGTQSAICYFLENYKSLGDAYLFNNWSPNNQEYLFGNSPGLHKTGNGVSYHLSSNGVKTFNLQDFYNMFSVIKPRTVIISCHLDLINKIRGQISQVYYGNGNEEEKKSLDNCNWGIWTGHDVDQPINECWKNPDNHLGVDFYAFVSNWQRRRYVSTFPIKFERTFLLKNGISTPFEKRFLDLIANPIDEFIQQKKNIIVYASVPFRGLEHFIHIFPLIRQKVPDCILRIYSGMNTYFSPEDRFTEIYKKLSNMEGVELHNGVSQEELANGLSEAKILAYPCTFAETSCITMLEAISRGCYIVSSDLGALSETSGGNAFLIENSDELNNHKYDGYYVKRFVGYICDLLQEKEIYPDKQNVERIVKGMQTVLNNNIYKNIVIETVNNIATLNKRVPYDIFNGIKKENLMNLGIKHHQSKLYKEAINYWKQILNISVDLEQTYINLIISTDESGDLDSCIKYCIDFLNYMKNKYENIPEQYKENHKHVKAKLVNLLGYRLIL